ncbi:PH domain-containing protein [Bacillus sp. Marseille-P3661]|uniref:PH domain-containing protein n=1 Tax=Bacillus sp. Marseille-P3661 TaxID=1936234 RepID=UPI0015E162DE|nr:PH domain-containing protein [Bacillus sp. Marseille-P3661]
MKYQSKRDWWLTFIIWGTMLFAIGSGGKTFIDNTGNTVENIVTALFTILLPIFILWLWFTTYYIIDEDNLVIKYGPFKKTVPLKSIKSVRKTMNPLSSPALSLKRLEIVYGQFNSVLISPLDRERFMDILSKRCPHAIFIDKAKEK